MSIIKNNIVLPNSGGAVSFKNFSGNEYNLSSLSCIDSSYTDPGLKVWTKSVTSTFTNLLSQKTSTIPWTYQANVDTAYSTYSAAIYTFSITKGHVYFVMTKAGWGGLGSVTIQERASVTEIGLTKASSSTYLATKYIDDTMYNSQVQGINTDQRLVTAASNSVTFYRDLVNGHTEYGLDLHYNLEFDVFVDVTSLYNAGYTTASQIWNALGSTVSSSYSVSYTPA